jgi:hypothetical protein
MLRENDHELVVNPDRLVDVLAELLADLEILSVKPAADSLGLKIRVQAFGEVLVLGTVADET